MGNMQVQIYDNPKNDAYRKLIDYAIQNSTTFVLATRDDDGDLARTYKVIKDLSPHLIKKVPSNSIMGLNSIAYTETGSVYYYPCNPETAHILKTTANSLFDWLLPNLPEDLCFLDQQGKDWLVNIAHEGISYIRIDEDEAQRISQEITGLFLVGSFNKELVKFLDDAKRHKTERLDISNNDIREIPEIIGEMSSLKSLFIFEQEITYLPTFLFNLTQLESLTIYTEKLDAIPREIGRLINLKHLTIYCISYSRLEPGRRMIDKSEVPLDRLPAEIGLLSNLETLDIQATRLSSLPQEFRNLKKLRSVNLSNNLFVGTPPELEDLQLEFLLMESLFARKDEYERDNEV